MIQKITFCHNIDDDHAPVDYSYVSSTSEGRRRRQQQNLKSDENQGDRVSRVIFSPQPAEVKRSRGVVHDALPTQEGRLEQVDSIAYPEDYGIPDNPFTVNLEAASTSVPAPPSAAINQQQVITAEDGSQYAEPAKAEMPEWLRVAQQNHIPLENRRAQMPRIMPAPRMEEEQTEPARDILGRPLHQTKIKRRTAQGAGLVDQYAQAGYPKELLWEQQEFEQQQREQGQRRRHGAQHAVKMQNQEEYERSIGQEPTLASYPPPRMRNDERRRARKIEDQPIFSPQELQPSPEQGRQAAYAAAKAYEGQENPYLVQPSVSYQEPPYSPQPAPGYAASPYAPLYAPVNPEQGEIWEDEAEAEGNRALRIPWLGIGIAVLALLATALWLMQMNFATQTEQILIAREKNSKALLENHPYRYEELIESEAAKNNLHPAFVAALVLNESSFNPQAESNVGARGLMQVMDGTAQYIYQKMNPSMDGYEFDQLYTPEVNVEFGCWYLGYLSEIFRGDPVLVAAGYHAGPTQVKNWLNDSTYSSDNLTLELEKLKDGPTKSYAGRVLKDYSIYKRLYYESAEEDI